MNLRDETNWREKLDCYYGILSLLRSILTDRQMIDNFFFSQYGPEDYVAEPESLYLKRLQTLPTNKISYIRIRIHPMEGKYTDLIDSVSRLLNSQTLVWDFEILKEYDIRGDLGNRYGKRDNDTIDDEATINFVKYWNAGCNYILSVLNESNDFRKNVDVWGIPHLINNAVGSLLRLLDKCPKCNGRIWLTTNPCEIPQEIKTKTVPLFLVICQDCDFFSFVSMNI